MTRLLVIRMGAMGDLLHASASLALLPPTVEVTWLTSPLYLPLVSLFDRVNQVVTWDKKAGWQAYCQVIKQLTQNAPFDGVINWQPSLKTWWLAKQVSPNPVFTYKKQKLPVTGLAVRALPRRHAIEDFAQPVYGWLQQTRQLITPKPLTPFLTRLPEPPLLLTTDTYHLGIIPGVGQKRGNRGLTPAYWLTLLRHLVVQNKRGVTIHLFGGPDEQVLCQQLTQTITDQAYTGVTVVNHAARWSIVQTATLLKQCDVVWGGDTGPTHLAAAVGANVISPFGPTDSRRTGPRGINEVTVLKPDAQLACWPCEKPTCALPANHQLDCLNPSQWALINVSPHRTETT